MARITVEDCLKRVESRFELVLLAGGRAKKLLRGAKPVVDTDNREIVTALREIAEGKVYFVAPEAKEPEPSDESGAESEAQSLEEEEQKEE